MESKKGFGKQLEQIIEGKGFYIVMALCAAIIGVSVWSLLRTPAVPVDEAEFEEALSDVEPMPFDPIAPELAEAEAEETASEPVSEQVEDDNAQMPEAPAAETAAEQTAVWPLEGAVQRDYSLDRLQYDKTMADWRTHDGVDLAAEVGTKVAAIRSGTVQNVYADDLYGTTVVIDHGNGLVVTYANLEKVPTVYAGDTVKAGDVIGSVGDTATCESAQESHLHLSARLNEKSVSPLEYLPQKS